LPSVCMLFLHQSNTAYSIPYCFSDPVCWIRREGKIVYILCVKFPGFCRSVCFNWLSINRSRCFIVFDIDSFS
jgi:hypothetical protein